MRRITILLMLLIIGVTAFCETNADSTPKQGLNAQDAQSIQSQLTDVARQIRMDRGELSTLRKSSERLNTQRGILITVLVVLAIVVLLQWSLNRHRWRINQLLQAKNNKIEEQKRELEKTLERLHAAAMERESAHQEIVELERKNSVLALAVTANHEINQPLMVIQGNLDLLEMNSATEKRDMHFQRIRDSIGQIQEILQKLNKLHKVHFKQYSSSTSMVDLDKLIEEEIEE